MHLLLAHAIQIDTETTGSMTLGSPKYRQIANRMVSEMRNGTYEVGDRLPTEHRLMAAFGVSRHTVRQATQLLKQMGVIEAHQGKGSVVVSKPSPPEFVERVHSVEAPVDKGTNVNRRLIQKRIVRANTELADAFGCDTDRDFLELQYLRNIVQKTELPAVFLKVWIDPMFGSIASLLETEGGTTRDAIIDVMKRRYEFETAAIRQNVSACALDEAAADILDRPVGECALRIERRYYQSSATNPHIRTVSICRHELLSIESYFQTI